MTLRQCSSPDACSIGIGKLTSSVAVVGATDTSVTLAVAASFDVADHQEMESPNMKAIASAPAGASTLHQHQNFAKTATISFGEMRKIEFAHGVTLNLCVNRATESGIPENESCQTDQLMSGVVSQSVVRPL
ncbi:hypothetical protein [Pandoraea terrigena]|nr:hypothetical protein [Pandoraea terrigena]